MDCVNRYPSNKKWYIRGVFHLISQHRKSVISNTEGNVSYQIQTLKEWYINTRKRVSYDIQTQKEWYIKREKEFFLSYQNTERVLYHTRETVFVMIFKHRESDYITHQNECFIWFSNTKKCKVKYDLNHFFLLSHDSFVIKFT